MIRTVCSEKDWNPGGFHVQWSHNTSFTVEPKNILSRNVNKNKSKRITFL